MNEKFNMLTEEWLDIVDDNNVVIDCRPRSYVRECAIKNYRIVLSAIRNEQNDFFVIKRAVKPNTGHPGAIALIGGCVSSGETYEQAMVRETYEETGIVVEPHMYQLLGVLTPQQDGTPAFAAVFEVRASCNVLPHDDVFSECYWLPLAEIRRRLAAGVSHAPSLPILLRKFYSHE